MKLGALRLLVVLIAIAGAVDPAITTNRVGRANVSVVPVDAHADSALADRVSGELAKRFEITRAAFGGADATVLVGDQLPAEASDFAAPAFAVTRERATTTIESIRAPATAPSTSRVPVEGRAHVVGARGKSVELTLRAGGVIVDRVTRPIATDDARVPISLSFVPATTGALPLRVSAQVAGSDASNADLLVESRDDRYSILFFDARPSWMSTFVRRSVEEDRRFVVTSRVVTSRNISTDFGRPPARLEDLSALGLFDAIVVGAPEALTDADVDGLERFMRRRGGSVVLLFDHRSAGPVDRLVGVSAWTTDSSSKLLTIGDSSGLRATSIAYPRRPTEVAHPIATANGHPVVWRVSVGAGRIVVNGAFDSWRFRDASVSGFDQFWRTQIGEAAAASLPAISARLASNVLRPGERTTLRVLVRDAALFGTSASVPTVPNAVLVSSGAPGEFIGELRAPTASGIHRVEINGAGNRVDVPILVGDVERASSDDRDLVAAWTSTHRGRVVRVDDVAGALLDVVKPIARAETWHPMRSAWWILPFALVASAEWWMRRRRGLR